MTAILPKASTPLVQSNGLMTPEWYRLFQVAFGDVNALTALSGADTDASTMPGNVTGLPAPDVRLTAAQIKTFLAIAPGDVAGLVASLATKTIEATAAEYLSDASGAKALTPSLVWDAVEYSALTDAATIAVDMAAGVSFSCSIAGNRTLGNPTNAKVGQSGCFKVTASGGSRTLARDTNYKSSTITWPISIASGQTAYLFYFVDTPSRVIVTAEINNPT